MMIGAMRNGVHQHVRKKQDLSTGRKDNDVNTSASVKQSSLSPGKGVGNSQVKYFRSFVE